MQPKKIIFSILIVVLVSTCFAFAHTAYAGTDVKEIIPELRIKIPEILEGFDAPAYVEECPEGGTSCPDEAKRAYVYIPWIAQYVSAIYRYALILASIMSVVAIMIGGILYLTSAGFPTRIDQAKKIIFGALTGMAIILFSYVFLNLINPELVSLRPIRIEAVKREVLTTGRDCLNVEDPNKVLVQAADGAWYAPTQGNAHLFTCGTSYKIKSNSAEIIIHEGETCEGSFCQKGSCAEHDGKKQCVEGLFYGEIRFTGGRYVDVIRLYSQQQAAELATTLGLGGTAKSIKEYDLTEGVTRYVIPRTLDLMEQIQKEGLIILGIEVNDSGASTAQTVVSSEGLKGALVTNVVGTALPTIDDDYFVGKDPSNPTLGMWIDPTCKICIFSKPKDEGGWISDVGCNAWTSTELLAAKDGIELNIDTSRFAEDTKLNCTIANALTKTTPSHGGQCLPTEAWSKVLKDGENFYCKPAGKNNWLWTTGAPNEVCDNLTAGMNTDFDYPSPSPWTSVYIEPVKCQNTPEYSCIWTMMGDGDDQVISNSCELAFNPNQILQAQYCAGFCAKEEDLTSDPGGICHEFTTCFKDENGNQLICDKSTNTCQYGEWGDHCESDFACKTPEFKCGDDNFCIKATGAEQWQACQILDNAGESDQVDTCKVGQRCSVIPYRLSSFSTGCGNFGSGGIDQRICWPIGQIDGENGVCDCDNNSECMGNGHWPEATFCNESGLNYCVKPIVGARCDTANPLPSGLQCDEESEVIVPVY